MKTFYLALISLLFSVLSYAQGNLTGKITDSKNQPFNYCKVNLIKDSAVVISTETDSTGSYQFSNIASNSYQLRIFLPMETIDTTVEVNQDMVFNFIYENGNELDVVEFTAENPIVVRKVDRIIFDPSNIPALVGKDATDVFEFAPGVFIVGDNIQLANGRGVSVMLNEKLIPLAGAQLIAFLRAIPSEDILYIEIIPIPPVKYASTITGSLINIRLVLGSKSKHSSGGISANIGQKTYSQHGASANYSFRSNKFSLYTNGNADFSHYLSNRSTNIVYDSLLWDQQKLENARSSYYSGSVGMNYELNKKTEIGLLAVLSQFERDNNDRDDIEKIPYYGNSTTSIYNQSIDKSVSNRAEANLSLARKIDTLGQKLEFNVDYSRAIRDVLNLNNTRYYQGNTDSLSSFLNTRDVSANFISGGIDYNLPKKKYTFTTGIRYSYGQNEDDVKRYNYLVNPNEADTLQSNKFQYTEHIQGAYASIDWKRKRWSFQVGLRAENTFYIANSITSNLKYENQYFTLIPKLFAMYETANGQFWNFSYSKDISRPYYGSFNPFVFYTSAYSYSTGNPYLKPIMFHDLSISTSIKDFTFNGYISYTDKMITQVTVYDNETQLQNETTANLFNAFSTVLYIDYYKLIKKRTKIKASMSGMFMNREVISTIASQRLTNFTYTGSLSLNQALDKKASFFLDLSVFYLSPYLEQITKRTLRPFISFELSKNFFKDRMNITFQMNDPFRIETITSVTRSNTNIISTSSYNDSQGIQLSCRYKLGNRNLQINQGRTNKTGEAGRI